MFLSNKRLFEQLVSIVRQLHIFYDFKRINIAIEMHVSAYELSNALSNLTVSP